MLYVLISLAIITLVLIANGWVRFGKKAEGTDRQALRASSRFKKGKFRNQLPLKNYTLRSIRDGFFASAHRKPNETPPFVSNDGKVYLSPPASGLRVTWLGHSTMLLEIDGATVLLDPVWGERASPFSWMGPRRWYESPLSLEDLPQVDAVLVSHDHYDHLNHETIVALKDRVPVFVVPLGVGSHLRYWGVPRDKIVEVDWWQEVQVADVNVVATPARHASGRHLMDLDSTLWAGFAVLGSRHRVYYSGDTGLFPGFKEIGERLGPFDLAMIETGAYNRNWPDWHLGPEQAVIANDWVKGKQLLPIHWGLFDLSFHSWTEPVERVLAASAYYNLSVATPRPGEVFEPGVTTFEKWWPDVPWQEAAEHHVSSSLLTDLTDGELALIRGEVSLGP